jgi:hypothetical protein
LKCKTCGAALDLSMGSCPACGSEVELGRLTGILGIVCRACDAYNDPGAETCAACGKPLGVPVHEGGGAATRFAPVTVFRTPSPDEQSPKPVAAKLGRAKLVLERGEGRGGATYELDAESVEAGRSGGPVQFPEDPYLAPHHVTFLSRAGTLHVRDEGAPGGTFLRLRGTSVPLQPGDHFAVGDRLLRYAGPLPPSPAQSPDGTLRLGAPRPAAPTVVLEESIEGGVPGRVFVRLGPSVTLGRAGCAVNLGDDPYLSQAHAELLVAPDGTVRLRDLGSSSGTFVRMPPRGERELRDGDAVRIGREVLRVSVA